MRALLVVASVMLMSSVFAADPQPPDFSAAHLDAMAARFVPVDVSVDISSLPANEKLALRRMIEAARLLDPLFMRQVSAVGPSTLLLLQGDASALGQSRLRYFMINRGPWSTLDEDQPFIPGVGPKPKGGNFYPSDATRDEVQVWMESLPAKEREAAQGFFTTVRRLPSGTLTAVPYSVEYQGELIEAARLLREAAAATTQPTLKSFLEKRSRAFLTNDYYESDIAWMELDASIEPTIGPYEVYEDEWFNFKAAFEAFILLTDTDATGQLGRFSRELQELEDHLPIDAKFRNPKLGAFSPIRVADVVFASGDGNHGVQTAAYNLPNDERVVALKGSKRVMLKNFQHAKFDKVLVPISQRVLAKDDQALVGFEPFFTHILMHELMHGLGPQTIRVGGRETTVRQELKELNGTLEEAKADISGLWALQYLADKGVVPKSQEGAFYTTFLASTFRTLRFGFTDSHAKGMALQINSLLDQGAIRVQPDGSFRLDFAKARKAVTALTREIMTIQATGDYARAKSLLERMVVIRPEVKRLLDRLTDIPVDISPRFVTADELTANAP
jgi:hypothetical protein